jgi:hypothetical protein
LVDAPPFFFGSARFILQENREGRGSEAFSLKLPANPGRLLPRSREDKAYPDAY